MPPILRKNYILALLILLVLATYAALFETGGSAAEPRQASATRSNSGSFLNSPSPRINQGDGDVQVVLTTYKDGQVSSRVIGRAPNPGLTTSGNSSEAGTPLRPAAAGDIVISQVYGSGGNPGSTYRNNFIEFFNRTNSDINFNGWRIYIASDTGIFDHAISFVGSSAIPIGAHRYFLVQFGDASSNGAPLPMPDRAVPFFSPFPGIPPTNIFPSGKLFITPPGVSIFGSTCPLPNAQIVDFVGYGTTANCFEGTGPAPTIGNTTAALRKAAGCTDTDNNANDFLSGTPTPRNSSSPANNCAANPIDGADFFVRQHYSDFLNRQPDAAGLAFWVNQITSCGSDQACIELKRNNVSAAFFVSVEFQQTGYLVCRTYKAAFGNISGAPVPLTFSEFLPDTQQIGQGVVVDAPGWEAQLENNKVAYFMDFVTRLRFTNAYPTTLTPAEFVDALFAHAGVTPSASDRNAAINEFAGAGNTSDTAARGRAVRRVAENTTLAQQEFNRAFVLMQYFGYLRRNPNDAPEPGLNFDGYNFWLNKLNQFNGNYITAEMVKAFITSGEYRQRFAP